MDLRWKKIRHFLNEPFKIAHGSYEYRDSYIVAISSNNIVGYGEASIIPYYVEDVGQIENAFSKATHWIKGRTIQDPRSDWNEVKEVCSENTWPVSAIDCALWDLYGKCIEKRVVDILFPDHDPQSLPITSLTIGGGTVDEMKHNISTHPWPVYKIKIGMENDLEVLRALRKITGSIFRIDANGGLDPSNACDIVPELSDLNVEILEQPFGPEMDGFMPQIHFHGGPILMADESCHGPEDLEDCVGIFHGVNIKLLKAGGITPAYQMISKAKELSLITMIGCMTESSVGISAAASLLPGVDYADIDGALLLREDIASGVVIENGKSYLPTSKGLGISLHGKIF
jgi:L-alanine-DL-glutamate epimerase-like enolase superfamily enzyme